MIRIMIDYFAIVDVVAVDDDDYDETIVTISDF